MTGSSEDSNDSEIVFLIVSRIEAICSDLREGIGVQKCSPVLCTGSLQISAACAIQVIFVNRAILMIAEHREYGSVWEVLMQVSGHQAHLCSLMRHIVHGGFPDIVVIVVAGVNDHVYVEVLCSEFDGGLGSTGRDVA